MRQKFSYKGIFELNLTSFKEAWFLREFIKEYWDLSYCSLLQGSSFEFIDLLLFYLRVIKSAHQKLDEGIKEITQYLDFVWISLRMLIILCRSHLNHSELSLSSSASVSNVLAIVDFLCLSLCLKESVRY